MVTIRPGGPGLVTSGSSGRLERRVLTIENGATLRKVNVPVTRSGIMSVCIAVPGPGRYAIAVRHDVDGDNARGDWGDGGGFSRNPRITLTNLRPRYENVAIDAGRGVTRVRVVLNYRFGLSVRPVRA